MEHVALVMSLLVSTLSAVNLTMTIRTQMAIMPAISKVNSRLDRKPRHIIYELVVQDEDAELLL